MTSPRPAPAATARARHRDEDSCVFVLLHSRRQSSASQARFRNNCEIIILVSSIIRLKIVWNLVTTSDGKRWAAITLILNISDHQTNQGGYVTVARRWKDKGQCPIVKGCYLSISEFAIIVIIFRLPLHIQPTYPFRFLF